MKVEFYMKNNTVKVYTICTLTKEQLKSALKNQDFIEFRTPDGRDITIRCNKIDTVEILERGI